MHIIYKTKLNSAIGINNVSKGKYQSSFRDILPCMKNKF